MQKVWIGLPGDSINQEVLFQKNTLKKKCLDKFVYSSRIKSKLHSYQQFLSLIGWRF